MRRRRADRVDGGQLLPDKVPRHRDRQRFAALGGKGERQTAGVRLQIILGHRRGKFVEIGTAGLASDLVAGDGDKAQRLFLKTLELDPQQPQTRAYTLIYLGKLAAASGEAEQAVKYLQDALKVEGAPDKVRAEAQRTLAQIQKQ